MTNKREKPKILVVYEIPDTLISMENLLATIDVDLITAQSGNSTLSQALEYNKNLALILVDITVPNRCAHEIAALLNDAEETRHIPILFITTVSHDGLEVLKGFETGMIDFIAQPIIPEILLAKVQIFLNLWLLKTCLEFETSRRKEAELQIEYLAQYDPLTKLPNRRQLKTEVERTLAHAKRKNECAALLYLDLDGFKAVNDVFGHEAGDAVLIEVSRRLKQLIRQYDIIGRYGGDEFFILLSGITGSLSLANKLEMIIQKASVPFSWKNHELSIGLSIGVALYPEHGTNYDVLTAHADTAMYQAKKAGKNTFKFYSDKLNKLIRRRLSVEHQMRDALDKNELEVYFQPIIDANSGQPVAAEALLRWHNQALGAISPDEFIPIAENGGHINKIGAWVVQEVISVMNNWMDLRMAINVSSLQFNNSLLYDELRYQVMQGRLDANRLEVEITESLLLEKSDTVDEQMQAISSLGVQLSVDDFGTGYSALSYLKRCPVSTVKIDRSFVSDIPYDEENMTLVKAIIAMAHGLNLKVIAEGVETREQWCFLKQLKCDLLQGFYFSKPVPKEHFEHYLLKHQASGRY